MWQAERRDLPTARFPAASAGYVLMTCFSFLLACLSLMVCLRVEPHAGRRLSFRIGLSKARAGTKRRKALTRPA